MKQQDFYTARKALIAKQRVYDAKEGARLKAIRKSKGLKGYWVAEKMGVSTTYFSALENGDRHWSPALVTRYMEAIGA